MAHKISACGSRARPADAPTPTLCALSSLVARVSFLWDTSLWPPAYSAGTVLTTIKKSLVIPFNIFFNPWSRPLNASLVASYQKRVRPNR